MSSNQELNVAVLPQDINFEDSRLKSDAFITLYNATDYYLYYKILSSNTECYDVEQPKGKINAKSSLKLKITYLGNAKNDIFKQTKDATQSLSNEEIITSMDDEAYQISHKFLIKFANSRINIGTQRLVESHISNKKKMLKDNDLKETTPTVNTNIKVNRVTVTADSSSTQSTPSPQPKKLGIVHFVPILFGALILFLMQANASSIYYESPSYFNRQMWVAYILGLGCMYVQMKVIDAHLAPVK